MWPWGISSSTCSVSGEIQFASRQISTRVQELYDQIIIKIYACVYNICIWIHTYIPEENLDVDIRTYILFSFKQLLDILETLEIIQKFITGPCLRSVLQLHNGMWHSWRSTGKWEKVLTQMWLLNIGRGRSYLERISWKHMCYNFLLGKTCICNHKHHCMDF